MPKVTAGLKSPPLMRKKTQALTAREKPKDLGGWGWLDGLERGVVVA